MRNQKSPVPGTRGINKVAVKSTKSPSKRSVASQTSRTFVFVKEENLHFGQPTKLGTDGGLKRDYIKAINYLNSCHKLINSLSEKNGGNLGDKTNTFNLPTVTNYAPLFPFLIGGGSGSNKKICNPAKVVVPKDSHSRVPSPRGDGVRSGPKERRRSAEIVRKPTSLENNKLPPIPPLEAPTVTLIENHSAKLEESISATVKEQINDYLTTLQDDLNQKLTNLVVPNKPSSNQQDPRFDQVVKQKLAELSKFCTANKTFTPMPNFGDFPSVIMSDIDPEGFLTTHGSTVNYDNDELFIKKHLEQVKSMTSIGTNSSDIKSDSDNESRQICKYR